MSTPDQQHQLAFPWRRAVRVGTIIAAGFGAMLLVGYASSFGLSSETLLGPLIATLVIAPITIGIAAATLRFRPNDSDWDVGFVVAGVLVLVGTPLGLIVYVGAHMGWFQR